MFNVKLYAEFATAATAQKADREFAAELRNVRSQTGARFVNFSVFDYRKENPDAVHFLTYPADWIARYIRNSFMGADPLLAIDYRRVSVIDWMDLYGEPAAAALFDEFVDAGIGNNGLTVITNADGVNYCALSLIYQCAEGDWPILGRNNIDLFRFLCDRLAERYFELFENREKPAKPLTPRERQVLQLIALGHTDEQIASLIGVGKWTVVSHLQSAKFKLGCANRTAAVAHALSTGQIEYHRAIGE